MSMVDTLLLITLAVLILSSICFGYRQAIGSKLSQSVQIIKGWKQPKPHDESGDQDGSSD